MAMLACAGGRYVALLQQTLTSRYATEAAAPPVKVSCTRWLCYAV